MSDALKKLFLPLIQLPLIGGLWLWWDSAKERPIYAASVGVLYEIAVLALAFSKKVWAKIEDKAVERAADWLWSFASNFAPGFRGRYKKQVINDHGVFNVRGLGLINTYTLALDQVYVDLRIDPSNPQKFNLDPIAKKEIVGNKPIWNFLSLQKSKSSDNAALAIIGPPGSGKTTLLQHVALTFAANRQRRYRLRAYTPILLFLRDHIKTIVQENPPSLGKLAQAHFSNQSLFPTLKPPANWFEKHLERGKAMILLDGLDEIADLEQRKLISSWVDNQIRNYPRCRFVLTARPQGYRDAPLHRAHVLEVQPFDSVQVRRFIESWYLANEIISSGNRDDAGVRQRALRDANDLLQRLRVLPSLSALTVNPLLLTMIAMVHRYHGALPGSRVELYADICEVLLGRWRQTRGVSDSLTSAQKLVVLRPLAAHMMEHELRDVTMVGVLPVVEEPLRRVGVTGESISRFLSELQDSSGLLLEREVGRWSFAHLTFQEYLTAAHWLGQGIGAARDWSELVNNSWWHETLRLYAAQGDATPVVRACLDVDSVSALTLAADCLDEARELEPSVRRATEERVIADLESVEPARRRLAAEVQLSRRLNTLQRIDDQRAIDLTYLTCAEYQLFLDDEAAEGNYHQPDHWVDQRFAKGEALKPVKGIRPKDAEAFCRWLTQRQGGNVRYRLPFQDEARQHQARHNNEEKLAGWCRSETGYELVGLQESYVQTIMDSLRPIFTPSPVHILTFALIDNPNASLTLNDVEPPHQFGILDLRIAFSRNLDQVRDYARTQLHLNDSHFSQVVDFQGTPLSKFDKIRDLGVSLLPEAFRSASESERNPGLDTALGISRDRALALRQARKNKKMTERESLAGSAFYAASKYAQEYDNVRDSILCLVITEELLKYSNRTAAVEIKNNIHRVLLGILNEMDDLLNQFASLTTAIKSNNMSEARRIARPLLNISRGNILRNSSTILKKTSDMVKGELGWITRQAERKLLASLFDLNTAKRNEQSRTAPRFRLRSVLSTRNEAKPQFDEAQGHNLKALLSIVAAREDGTLAAWEGIRIVQEQILGDIQ